jgi:hypothetical protein
MNRQKKEYLKKFPIKRKNTSSYNKTKFFKHVYENHKKFKDHRGRDYFEDITEANPKLTDKWLEVLNSVSLEELIFLKLVSTDRLMRNRFIGLPIHSIISKVIKKAVVLYAMKTTGSLSQAAFVMGASRSECDNVINSLMNEDIKYWGYNSVV